MDGAESGRRKGRGWPLAPSAGGFLLLSRKCLGRFSCSGRRFSSRGGGQRAELSEIPQLSRLSRLPGEGAPVARRSSGRPSGHSSRPSGQVFRSGEALVRADFQLDEADRRVVWSHEAAACRGLAHCEAPGRGRLAGEPRPHPSHARLDGTASGDLCVQLVSLRRVIDGVALALEGASDGKPAISWAAVYAGTLVVSAAASAARKWSEQVMSDLSTRRPKAFAGFSTSNRARPTSTSAPTWSPAPSHPGRGVSFASRRLFLSRISPSRP